MMPHPENAVEPLHGSTDARCCLTACESFAMTASAKNSPPEKPASRQNFWPNTAYAREYDVLLGVLGASRHMPNLA